MSSIPNKDGREQTRLRISVWIENSDGKLLFGDGRVQILQAIHENGSLSAAAEKLGMSYRGMWAKLRHSEKRLGFALVESKSGRGPGSGTSLTPRALSLLEKFTRLRTQVDEHAGSAFDLIFEGGKL